MQLEDGKGRGYIAEVNVENELVARSITESELEHASGVLGTAYSFDSTELDIDAGDTMLFIKNIGDTPMILDRLILNGSNVICTWDIGIGTATTTPAGTTVTPVNLHPLFNGNACDCVAISDETAVADASVVMRAKTPVSNTVVLSLDGIILSKNSYIQINQETESTSGSAILIAHIEDPS
jgi:hypothetical protein